VAILLVTKIVGSRMIAHMWSSVRAVKARVPRHVVEISRVVKVASCGLE
jgi:hypothetical protein